MLFGSIINVICIIIGTLIGLLLTKIGDKYKETIMQGIALTVTLIGLQMALETNAVIIVLVSIVFGALLGELLKLEAILNWFGEWVTSKFKNKDNSFNIGQGFVTASLILDRKSTRLNSSHVAISYAVFCLKKKSYYKI